MKELVTRIRLESKDFISDMGSAKNSALALSAAVAGVATGMAALAIHAAETIDKNTVLARSAGEATDRFSAMSYAMKLGGVDAESLAAGMAKMARPEQQKNLVAMGIAVTDATGKLRSQTDVMLDLAGVIEKTNDPLRRLEIAQSALGKSGGQFIEALKDGPAALRELMTEADALGQVFSKEDAIAADQFNDNLDKLKMGVSGVSTEIGKSIVQWVNHTKILDGAIGIVKNVISMWRNMDQGTKEFVYTFGTALVATTALVGVLYGVIQVAPLVSAAIKAAFITNPIGLFVTAIALVAAGVIYMKSRWEEFQAFFAPLTAMIRNFQSQVSSGITSIIGIFSRFSSTLTPIKGIFDSIAGAFKNVDLVATGLKAAMAPMLITFYTLATVINVLVTAFDALIQVLRTPVGEGLMKFMAGSMTGNMVMMAEGVQKVSQGWGEASEIVKKASGDMKKSLSSLSDNVSTTLKNIVTKSAPAAQAMDELFNSADRKLNIGPMETFGNEFYKIYENAIKAKEGFAAAGLAGMDFKSRMQAIALGIEGVKGVFSSLSGMFTQYLQSLQKLSQTRLTNFTQNLDFMAGGAAKMLELQLAADNAFYDAQIKGLQKQKDALLDEERRYQDDLKALKDSYAQQRKAELDEEVKAEIRRLDDQYQAQVAYLEQSGVTGTELEARKADLLAQIEAQKNQAISQSQKRLQSDITNRNEELDAEAKVRATVQKQREEDLVLHMQMIEDQKAASAQATADKKAMIERQTKLMEWNAGRATFEIGKRAQMAAAVASVAMGVMNAIQAGVLLAATIPFAGWIMGPILAGTLSALVIAAGARTVSSISAQQYPPPPLFGDGGIAMGGAGGMGIIGDNGPEIAMPMNNPGKDFGALKGELASQLADAASGAMGGTRVADKIEVNLTNVFQPRDDYEMIKSKISVDLRDMVRGVIESVR